MKKDRDENEMKEKFLFQEFLNTQTRRMNQLKMFRKKKVPLE